jgi:hypothetical protein
MKFYNRTYELLTWIRGACEKSEVKCFDCGYREYLPVIDYECANAY